MKNDSWPPKNNLSKKLLFCTSLFFLTFKKETVVPGFNLEICGI